MSDAERVGSRVRAARKLAGRTQRQLAERAHVSLSLVKAVEQGRAPASPGFVTAVARALGVVPGQLYAAEAQQAAPIAHVDAAALRELGTALDAYDEPKPQGAVPAVDTLVERLTAVARLVSGLRYGEALQQLPELLHQLYTLEGVPGQAGEQARAALHDAYRMCATVAGRFRQPDLAAIATERHVAVAPTTGDGLRIAISAYHRSSRYLQHGDYRAGVRLLDRAREHLGTEAPSHAVRIQLAVRSAVLAARAGDSAEADDYIDEASSVSTEFRPPEAPYYNIDASRLNVRVHWCAVPVERYDGAEAVRRSGQVRVTDRCRPERVAHHHIDMARAWLLHGGREQTLQELNTARHTAPNITRTHPQVRETVLTLAEHDRRRTDSLAGFARWAGIHI